MYYIFSNEEVFLNAAILYRKAKPQESTISFFVSSAVCSLFKGKTRLLDKEDDIEEGVKQLDECKTFH